MTDFDWKKQRVLVTGATGPIGRHLVEKLQGQVKQIRVLSRHNAEKKGADTDTRIEPVTGDLETGSGIKNACTDIDVIFHLASYSPAESDPAPEGNPKHFSVTVEGTKNLLQAAQQANVKKMVFVSSTRVMDKDKKAYALAKEQAETLMQKSRMDWSILRLPPVYGIETGSISTMLNKIKAGRFPPVPETGNQRSMLHVDDAVQAMLLLAEEPRSVGQTYTATDGQALSTRELYEKICAVTGQQPRAALPVFLYKFIAMAGEAIQAVTNQPMPLNKDKWQKLTQPAVYEDQKIREELGFVPEHSLDDFITTKAASYQRSPGKP